MTLILRQLPPTGLMGTCGLSLCLGETLGRLVWLWAGLWRCWPLSPARSPRAVRMPPPHVRQAPPFSWDSRSFLRDQAKPLKHE